MKTTLTFKQKLLGSSQLSWRKFTNSCNFLKLETRNLLLVFLFLTTALIPTSSFAQITSGFELDGNAQADLPNPPDDWDNTGNAQVITGVVNDAPSNDDNAFTVGSKDQDDINTWGWQAFSVPDKDDILHAGAALYANTSIYFFGDRFSNKGDAALGFWLFKNAVSANPDGTFSGTHAIGDILLISNFSGGGGVVTIKAFEWVGSGGSHGTLDSISVTGTNLYAITNSSVSPSPWPYQEKFSTPANFFPKGAFFEGGINFAGLGFGINPCFTSFLMETRSSTSITAALKDFVFGSFFTKPQVTVNSAAICAGNPALLTATVVGGAQPPTYAWSPGGATTPSISVSPSVTTSYTVVVTAANRCAADPAVGTVNVGQLPGCSIGDPNPLLLTVRCKLNAGAAGNTNTVSTITNLDLSLYTLSWSITPSHTVMTGWTINSNGANTMTFQSGLCGPSSSNVDIALTVTNKATGCASTCHKIFEPSTPQCGLTPNPHGSLNCSITQATLSAAVNVDNPIISWTAGVGGNIVSGQGTASIIVDAPGTYTITATDAVIGCTVSATFTVTEDIAVPSLTLTPTNVTCNGLGNGSINLNVSGGTPPLAILWAVSGNTTSSISNLVPGNYSVAVTGANGCTANGSAAITEPPVVALTATPTAVLCNGGNTGSITASASGGVGSFLYALNSGTFVSSPVFSGLIAGTYTIHVKDANNCPKQTTVIVTEPTIVALTATPTAVLCNGGNTGSITAGATGGVGSYSFSINAGAFSTNNVFGSLSAGTYTIHVKDANNCPKETTVIVTQATNLTASITNKVDVLCFGGNNGSIDLTVSGGTPSYNYLWSNGATSQDISGLVAGNYSVVVTDAHGCTATASATISQPTVLISSILNKVDVNCNGGNNGSINLNVSGGTLAYSFLWSPGGATTEDINGLVAGIYSVVVTDAHGCITTASATVTQPPVLTASITSKVDVLCFGGNNGSIDLSVSGGTTVYTYLWSNTATTQDISGLVAGNYSVVVTDAHGCTATASATISQPTELVSSIANKVDVLCFGGNNGSINLNVSGGTLAYSFLWSPGGAITEDISGLVAGIYSVVVTDSHGCITTASATITQPPVLTASITSKVDVLCFGGNNGSIDLSVSGGTTVYTYLWSNNATTQDISGLVAGNYSVVVTDANGCTATASATINQPTELVSSIANKVDVLCFGENNGSINLSVSGGSPAYSFLWSPGGAITEDISGLIAGIYSVVVTDSHGCITTASATITEPELVTCSLTAPEPLPACGSTGNHLSATASPAGLTYSWTVSGAGWSITAGQGTADITYTAGQDDGSFVLVVTGINGCTHTCRVTFGVRPCANVFCTLTQGFWGQSNGVACATGEKASVLVPRLLGAPYGNLIIGKPGRSLTITQARANCVTLRMPSGGPSVMLPVGDQSFDANCATTSIPLNKGGRFNNTLLGQTIALGLNLRLDAELGALVIQAGTFTTAGASPGVDGLCGTEDDVPDLSSTITKSIPASVITALNTLYGSATIANLFDLANRALGGQSTAGASLNDINAAVSAINEGFDHCAFLIPNAGNTKIAGVQVIEESMEKAEDIAMKAFPNPFANSTTIEFATKTDVQVVVTVYNVAGAKVIELFDGMSKAGVVNKVIFKGENLADGLYIYKIRVGDKVYFDRLMLQK